MTNSQKKAVQQIALKLKQDLSDFYGSVTFHLTANKKMDIKIEIKEMAIAKQDFAKL